MTANERLVLFAVTVGLAVLAGVLAAVHVLLRKKRFREKMTPDLAMQEFCWGDGFDLKALLDLFGRAGAIRDVEFGTHTYRATLSDGHTRFELSLGEKDCFLKKLEYYCDANQQFQGWYTHYDAKNDKCSAHYYTYGADIHDREASTKELPSFRLTGRAIREISLYFIERSHERRGRRR